MVGLAAGPLRFGRGVPRRAARRIPEAGSAAEPDGAIPTWHASTHGCSGPGMRARGSVRAR
eukprot:334118-Alexandrium_andersonii.AAC.1